MSVAILIPVGQDDLSLLIRGLDGAANWTEGDIDCGACAAGRCDDEDHLDGWQEVWAWRALSQRLEHQQAISAA